MYILRAFILLFFLTRVVLAQQPTPILPDPKLTPGDTFEVTAQDVCVLGYRKEGASGTGVAQKAGVRRVRDNAVQDRRLRG
jgi:hypothetical protein